MCPVVRLLNSRLALSVATALAEGYTYVDAEVDGQLGGSVIGVSAALVPIDSVTLTPDSVRVAVGYRLQLVADIRDTTGAIVWLPRLITWTSSDPTVATVAPNSSRRRRDDFGWGPAENLGAVNTAVDEVTPDPFADEGTGANKLYLGSGPIGSGAIDIHVATQLDDGSYGPSLPVAELNSSSLDRQPATGRDGLEIYLASDRPGTIGLLDVWIATRATTSDPWSTPVNLGPVINTTSVEARPAISFKDTELYFQSTRTGGLGNFDLYVTPRTKLKGQEEGLL